MDKSTIIREQLQQWKDLPSLTLAKKIYREFPEYFAGVENVRSNIRYLRGQHGNEHREQLAGNDFLKEAGALNPFAIPESDAIPRIPVELEGRNTLMLYDAHLPYHDKVSLDSAVEEGVRRGCDSVFLGGDGLDCHLISRYEKDPRKRKFVDEIKMMKEFLGYLRFKFPDALLYYKEGNHEERYTTFMRIKAPELIGLPFTEMSELLDLDNFGVEWINGKTKARLGKLSVFHGHELGRTVFSPVNVARGLYLRAKASSICGHMHSSSEHTERDINDKIVTCWSVGCLSELSPDYAPYNKWNHGYAIIERDGQSFRVENFRMRNGKIL